MAYLEVLRGGYSGGTPGPNLFVKVTRRQPPRIGRLDTHPVFDEPLHQGRKGLLPLRTRSTGPGNVLITLAIWTAEVPKKLLRLLEDTVDRSDA